MRVLGVAMIIVAATTIALHLPRPSATGRTVSLLSALLMLVLGIRWLVV